MNKLPPDSQIISRKWTLRNSQTSFIKIALPNTLQVGRDRYYTEETIRTSQNQRQQ